MSGSETRRKHAHLPGDVGAGGQLGGGRVVHGDQREPVRGRHRHLRRPHAPAQQLGRELHAAAPPLYRRFAHLAFLRGTLGDVAADPAPGNVLESRGPHAVEGCWRSRRRGVLRRALLAAAVGSLRGLFKRRS